MPPPLRLPCRLCGRIQLGIVFGQEMPMLLCFGCAERMFGWIRAASNEQLKQVWRFQVPPFSSEVWKRTQAHSSAVGEGAKIIPFPAREPGAPPKDPVESMSELAAELRAEGADDGNKPEPSVEDVFAEFKKGLENIVSSEDSETHYDLAIAYREMGLIKDALTEWIEIVIAKSRPKMKIAALEQMFHPAFLQDDGIEALRAALFPG